MLPFSTTYRFQNNLPLTEIPQNLVPTQSQLYSRDVVVLTPSAGSIPQHNFSNLERLSGLQIAQRISAQSNQEQYCRSWNPTSSFRSQMDHLNPIPPSFEDQTSYLPYNSLPASPSTIQENLSPQEEPEFFPFPRQESFSNQSIPSFKDLEGYLACPMQENLSIPDDPESSSFFSQMDSSNPIPYTPSLDDLENYPFPMQELSSTQNASSIPAEQSILPSVRNNRKIVKLSRSTKKKRWTKEQTQALHNSIQNNKDVRGNVTWSNVANDMKSVRIATKIAYKRQYKFSLSQTLNESAWTDEQAMALVDAANRNTNQYGYIQWERVARDMEKIKKTSIPGYKKKYWKLTSVQKDVSLNQSDSKTLPQPISSLEQRIESNKSTPTSTKLSKKISNNPYLWTEEKDNELLLEIKTQIINNGSITWSQVSHEMQGVDQKSCQSRAYQLAVKTILQNPPSNNSITTKLGSREWTQKQNRTLIESIKTHTDSLGTIDWKEVRQDLQNVRKVSIRACQNRFNLIVIQTLATI